LQAFLYALCYRFLAMPDDCFILIIKVSKNYIFINITFVSK
jgi:hypothetical protein